MENMTELKIFIYLLNKVKFHHVRNWARPNHTRRITTLNLHPNNLSQILSSPHVPCLVNQQLSNLLQQAQTFFTNYTKRFNSKPHKLIVLLQHRVLLMFLSTSILSTQTGLSHRIRQV
uniref:Uncharacterized protein n=1 Tax=Cacopsylla melanoneura TaxID=428564 RepID=A0A8D8ZIL2_9HEMI